MRGRSSSSAAELRLLSACAALWAAGCGGLLLAVEATDLRVFLALLAGPLLTYLVLKRFSLPPPDEARVLDVLGLDFRADEERARAAVSDILSCDDDDDDDCSGEGLLVLKVIGHRFAGIDAPENSLVALETCYRKGCVAVEFDVAMTADRVPVVFHDATVDRLTGSVGDVRDMTWDTLRTLDISVNHPFHERFKDTRVAQLEDVIKKCLEYDMRMFIDVKDSSSEMIDVICGLFDKWPQLYRRAVVSSFNPLVVYGVRERRPEVVGSMAWRPRYQSCSSYGALEEDCRPYYASPLARALAALADAVTTALFDHLYYRLLGLSVVLINKDAINNEVVNRWQKRGVRVIAWTVNVPSEKAHFSRNLRIAYMTDTMAGD